MNIQALIAQTLERRAAVRRRDSRHERYNDRAHCRDLAEATREMLETQKHVFKLP